MSMRGNFAVQFIRFLNQGPQLFKAVLSSADGVALRQHTAGRAGFDYVGAVFDLITHGGTNLFRTIGNAVDGTKLQDARPESVLVTVTTGDSNRVAGSFHARPNYPALIDRFAQSHIVKTSRSADVAYAGEPGH